MTLEARIQKKYGDFRLDAAFTAGSGGPLALLGASGSGKSVTLRCLAGIDTPDRGRIVLDGRTLFDSERGINLPPQRRRIGYLFQQYALFPHMTVEQNIAAGLRRLDRSGRRARTAELIAMLRLEGKEKLLPRQLSGGQQQRTALARILAAEPDVILLDEPLAALDSYLKWQLETELRDVLERFGGPVIWVSHDLGEVCRSCRSVCVLDEGKSSPVRSFPELLADPVTVSAARISGCGNYAAASAGPEAGLVTAPEWGLVLRSAKPWRAGITTLGIRADRVRPAAEGEENAFLCWVRRIVEDAASVTAVLEPVGAAGGAPPLRMEVRREKGRELPDERQLWVKIYPEDLLLLEE